MINASDYQVLLKPLQDISILFFYHFNLYTIHAYLSREYSIQMYNSRGWKTA